MWWIIYMIYGWWVLLAFMVICWLNQGHVLRLGNRVADYYLDWKYKGYQYQPEVTSSYCLTKVVIDRGGHSREIILYGTDLKRETVTLQCGRFGSYMAMYIYFSHGTNTYILPIAYDPDLVVTLPFYDFDDIETCMKEEYTSAETKNHHDEILSLIQMYAGPKGNFYTDTPYKFNPSLIYDRSGSLLLNGEDDYLRLTNMMGDTIEVRG